MPKHREIGIIAMAERRAQEVLLVRAFEESDRDGRIISTYARTAATRRALTVTGLSDYTGELGKARNIRNGETVMRRARLLFDSLERKVPVLRRVLLIAQLGASTAPALIGGAFVAGLLTDLLGGGSKVNLLSIPLLGLLAWNVAVYAAMVVAAVVRRLRPGSRSPFRESGWLGGGIAQRLSGAFLRSALGRRLRAVAGDPESEIAGSALVRFTAMWHRAAAPLHAARVRRILHLAAASLLIGAVTAMYVRGIALEYRATWESTWLNAEQVQTVLGLVLGPASRILNLPVPDVAPLRGPEGSGPAAPWIHLYAATAALVVVVPRIVMALYQTWRARRLSRRIPVDLSDAYFRRTFTAWRGASRIVRIVPYSFRPQAGAVDTLKTLLHECFGARADIRVREPLAYGDDASALVAPAPDDDREAEHESHRETAWVVLFNLAQSPEPEVHGRLLEELRDSLETRPGRLLVLVDVSTYHGRVDAPERWAERLQAWKRVASEAGLEAVDVALDRPSGDDVLEAVGAGIWEGSEAGEGVARG